MMLLERLPEFLRSPEAVQIQGAMEVAVSDFLNALKDMEKQLYVDTATWGLERWERLYGLPVSSEKDTAERRSKILSRIRGYGTATKALIEKIANSFENGTVEVKENPKEYSVSIQFVGRLGPPPNLTDLQNAINRVIPAHLKVEYVFVYRTWAQVSGNGMTWLDAAQYTWNELKSKSEVR